jgi:hypothetical protein
MLYISILYLLESIFLALYMFMRRGVSALWTAETAVLLSGVATPRTGPWLVGRVVGDAEGEVEFRAAWVTAVNMWFERMAAPYTPKKPAVARKAVELFNAFVGAGFKYEELFPPPPPPKPAEAAKPETKPAVEAVEERGLRREVEKPTAKPEAVKPKAPIADVIPERVLETVDYLLGRFGVVLDVEAAFKAKSLATAKVKAGEGGRKGARVRPHTGRSG